MAGCARKERSLVRRSRPGKTGSGGKSSGGCKAELILCLGSVLHESDGYLSKTMRNATWNEREGPSAVILTTRLHAPCPWPRPLRRAARP